MNRVFLEQLVKYGLVIFFNVLMWGCYVNSLKALSSLQATVTNFAINFLTSGLAGFFLFEEALSFKVITKFAARMVNVFSIAILTIATTMCSSRKINHLLSHSVLILCFISFFFYYPHKKDKHVLPKIKIYRSYIQPCHFAS